MRSMSYAAEGVEKQISKEKTQLSDFIMFVLRMNILLFAHTSCVLFMQLTRPINIRPIVP